MMDTTEDIEKLAETCLANAKIIKEYLTLHGHPQPTFDQNGPSSYPQMSQEAEYARLQLRASSKSLNELASGPDDIGQYVYNSVSSKPASSLFRAYKVQLHDLNAYRYVWRYKIAFAIPDTVAVSYKEVAEKTGTDEKQMRKFIRQLIQTHVFCEPVPGHVAHTARSKILMHPGQAAFIAYNAYDNMPLVMHQLEAITRYGHGAQDVNQTPGNIVYSSDKSIYETYSQHPDVASRFAQLMEYVAGFEHYSNAHVVQGFSWNRLGDGVVVDIGGNMGHCCINIAKANPNVKCIVQDLQHVIDRAQDPKTTAIPEELRDRISFAVHSFFDVQTVSADAYFMRMIMHDFSDKHCLQILRAIVPAMRPGSRIIIMDQVLPPVGTVPAVYDRLARTMQLQMQLLSNGMEREIEEWEELIQTADSRLKIKNVKQPIGSLMAVIEVMLEEESNMHDDNQHSTGHKSSPSVMNGRL